MSTIFEAPPEIQRDVYFIIADLVTGQDHCIDNWELMEAPDVVEVCLLTLVRQRSAVMEQAGGSADQYVHSLIQLETLKKRKEYLQFTRQQAKQMVKVFRDSLDNIISDMAILKERGVLAPAMLPQLQERLSANIQSLNGAFAEGVADDIASSVKMGVQHSQEVLYQAVKKFNAKASSLGFNPVQMPLAYDASAWGHVAAGGVDFLMNRVPDPFQTVLLKRVLPTGEVYNIRGQFGLYLSDRVHVITDELHRKIRDTIADGIVRGRSFDDVARELRGTGRYWSDAAETTLVRTKTTGQGIYQSAHKNAMRIVRTEGTRAYREGHVRNWAQKDWIQGFKWNLSLAHPEADICDTLAAENSEGFPEGVYRLEELPDVAHPQCYCYLTPYVNINRMMSESGEELKVFGEELDKQLQGLEALKKSELMAKAKGAYPGLTHAQFMTKSQLARIASGQMPSSEVAAIQRETAAKVGKGVKKAKAAAPKGPSPEVVSIRGETINTDIGDWESTWSSDMKHLSQSELDEFVKLHKKYQIEGRAGLLDDAFLQTDLGKALTSFTEADFERMRHLLRAGVARTPADKILLAEAQKVQDLAMAFRSNTPRSLYRGVGGGGQKKFKKIVASFEKAEKSGVAWELDTLASASEDFSIAQEFAAHHKRQVILEFQSTVANPIRGVPVTNMAAQEELEVILAKGSKWAVQEVELVEGLGFGVKQYYITLVSAG